MKKFLLCFFLLCFAQSKSQNKTVDSLKICIKNLKSDTSQVTAINALSKEYIRQGNYKEAELSADAGLKLSESLNFKKGIIQALNLKGSLQDNQGNYSISLKHYKDAFKIATAINNKLQIATGYSNIGNNYFRVADYPNAIDNYLKSLKIAEEIKDSSGIAHAYSIIGVTLGQESNFEKAIENINKGLRIAELIKDKEIISSCYNFLGSVYFGKHDYDKSLESYKLCLKLKTELNSLIGISAAAGSLGAVYKRIKKYDLALDYCKQQLAIAEQLKDKLSIAIALYNIGGIYVELKKSDEAMDCFNKVKLLSIELGDPDQLRYAYDGIVTVYYNSKHFKEAFDNFERFKAISDSIFNLEKTSRLNEIMVKYDVEKKESANKMLAQENQIQFLQLNQNKFIIWVLSGLAVLILLIALLLIRQFQFRNQQREMQLEQKLLRSQMNPHFIFNSLQAIQNYILKHDQKEAVKYLSSFANITRSVLENSRMDLIPLKKEIALLENYLHLQKLRFGNRFEYEIYVDPEIDPENIDLPPMLSQPFIENALEHGMKDIESGGKIDIYFTVKDNNLLFEIKDNGKGIQTSDVSVKQHQSLALAITNERVVLMNKKKSKKTIFTISAAFPNELERKGVKVQFSIPI